MVTPETTSRQAKAPARSGASWAGHRRAGLLLLALLVLIAGLVWYVDYATRGRYLQTTNDAYVQADSVVVAPKVGGYVDALFVTANAPVRRGQQLLLLDPRDYRAQAAQFMAQTDAARATADVVRAQIAEQRAALSRAEAQTQAAQAEAGFASEQTIRYQPLVETGAESRERFAQLREQQRQADAQLEARRADVLASRRRLAALQSQVAQAASQAQASEAQLGAARINLESTVLRASTDGRVGDLSVRVGQFVQPATRLMTIVPVQRIYVEANFKETQVGLMRTGQPASIEVDALPGVRLAGRIASIAPGTGAQFSVLPPQNATGNFTKIVQRIPVRIALQAAPEVRDLLVPGMSVNVTVDTRSARGELARLRAAGGRR